MILLDSKNLTELLSAKDDIGTMLKWMDEYGEEIGTKGGRVMGWYRGPNPAIWTTSPEILKEVFIKDAGNFIDRPLLDRSDNIPHLINMRGDDWKRARYYVKKLFTLLGVNCNGTFIKGPA